MINNNEKITIIGCGISGISSAINLIEKVIKLELLSKKKLLEAEQAQFLINMAILILDNTYF